MDRKTLLRHERKILLGLTDFFLESGFKEVAYHDIETGGIYENKLAIRLGYELQENSPPGEFLAAARNLQEAGYVWRARRQPDYPILGIWPTRAGLDKAEYLRASALRKVQLLIGDNLAAIVTSVVTTVVTTFASLTVAQLLGLIG